MPAFDIAERHHVEVDAPGAVTLDVARRLDFFSPPLIRAIVKGRELVLGATPDARPRTQGLIAEMVSLGWGVLADIPGREIVLGAVTKPWEPNVTFRAIAPGAFAAFDEPGYVRIAWTLSADPIGPAKSIFRTETRAIATDPASRVRFRWYWSFFSPGILLIRRSLLKSLKTQAERRAREIAADCVGDAVMQG